MCVFAGHNWLMIFHLIHFVSKKKSCMEFCYIINMSILTVTPMCFVFVSIFGERWARSKSGNSQESKWKSAKRETVRLCWFVIRHSSIVHHTHSVRSYREEWLKPIIFLCVFCIEAIDSKKQHKDKRKLMICFDTTLHCIQFGISRNGHDFIPFHFIFFRLWSCMFFSVKILLLLLLLP